MLGKIDGRRRRGHQGMRNYIASLMQWTWTWANFRRWSGTGRPGRLHSMGSQRVRHDWVNEQQGYLGHRASHRTSCHQEKNSEVFLWNKHCIFISDLPTTKVLCGAVHSSVQLLSRVRLCNTMSHNRPDLPVHYQLPESTQIHVQWVGDAIQPSHPLSSPQSFPGSGSFQMSQLFASGSQSTGVSASTSALLMNTQDWSPLGWTDWNSLQSKGLSRVFSNTTVQKHQFFGTQLSLQSNSHIHTGLMEKP